MSSTKRRKICAGNWKMYKTPSEARSYLQAWQKEASTVTSDVVLFASAYNLHVFTELAQSARVQFGSQNIYFAKEGAFTGEISPFGIRELGCTWALIGHSERRTLFFETDEMIAKKIQMAHASGLKPMLCVGETLEERDRGQTLAVVERQIVEGLKLMGLSKPAGTAAVATPQAFEMAIAYEPVWAIGTGRVATPEQAEEVHGYIRKVLEQKYGADLASVTPVLYGGSVKPDNAAQLAQQKNIDGFLVGGASLKPADFLLIARALDAKN